MGDKQLKSNTINNSLELKRKNKIKELKKDSIEHLNFLLKTEGLPLKIRLLTKYLFSLQKNKDVILCVFLTCKMLEHRLQRDFLDKYDNNRIEYKKRELDFLKDINFKLDYSLLFLDLYVALFKLFEEDFEFFYDRNIDLEIAGNLRIKWNDFLKNGKNDNLIKYENYRNAMISAPENGNFLLNIFQFLKNKTNIKSKDLINNKCIYKLNNIFNKPFYGDYNYNNLINGFTGKELEENNNKEPLEKFIDFIKIIEDFHENDEIVKQFYENIEFPIYLFFVFIDKRELNMFQIIFDFNINNSKLIEFRNKFFKEFYFF